MTIDLFSFVSGIWIGGMLVVALIMLAGDKDDLVEQHGSGPLMVYCAFIVVLWPVVVPAYIIHTHKEGFGP